MILDRSVHEMFIEFGQIYQLKSSGIALWYSLNEYPIYFMLILSIFSMNRMVF